jgi:hypothetical protein
LDKAAQERRFSHTGLTDEKSDMALVLEESQAGQSFLESTVAKYPVGRGFFGKWVM